MFNFVCVFARVGASLFNYECVRVKLNKQSLSRAQH